MLSVATTDFKCLNRVCVTIKMCFCLCCCCLWYQWPYGDICGIGPVGKGQGTEFNLTFRKGSGKKSETLKFSTEHRTELLTEALVRRTDAHSCITSQRPNRPRETYLSKAAVFDVAFPCFLVESQLHILLCRLKKSNSKVT